MDYLAIAAMDASEMVEISDPSMLPDLPVVSVLMLTYNHKTYIGQAVESVVSQKTNFSIEILIGEDCSNDGTRAIVEEYQRRHPYLIRIISGPRNIGSRRNSLRLQAQARGIYVAFCEGDDWWTDTNKLQRQYEIMAADSGISLCVHAAKVFDQGKGKFAYERNCGRRARVLRIEELIENNGGNVMTCTLFLKKALLSKVFERIGIFPVGDYPIKAWCASEGRCYYLPEPMATFRIGTGTSWSSTPRNASERWGIQRAIIEMVLSLERDLMLPRAAVRNQISRILRDTCLYGGHREIASWPDYQAYHTYMRPTDRLLIFFISRFELAGAAVRKLMAVYRRVTNRSAS